MGQNQSLRSCWTWQSTECLDEYWKTWATITLYRMLLRLKFSLKELGPLLFIVTTAVPQQIFGTLTCSMLVCNAFHTGPALMPANSFPTAGWKSSGKAWLFLFNSTSCPHASSPAINDFLTNRDNVPSNKPPGSPMPTPGTLSKYLAGASA